MILETSRAELRLLTEDDYPKLLDLDSDPEVMRYLSKGVPSTKEDVAQGLERALLTQARHGGRLGYWAATERATGDFMGWFMVRPPHADPFNLKRVELGYRIKKRFWGKGFATEIAKFLVERSFRVSNVEEIYAVAVKANEASQAVMRKIGLTLHREYESADFSESMETVVEYVKGKSESSSFDFRSSSGS